VKLKESRKNLKRVVEMYSMVSDGDEKEINEYANLNLALVIGAVVTLLISFGFLWMAFE